MPKSVLAAFALLVPSCAALAQAPMHGTPIRIETPVVAQTRESMAAFEASLARQRADLDAGMRDVATWSEQDRARFAKTVWNATPNTDYERQIAAMDAELRGLQHMVQRGEIKGLGAEARYAVLLRDLLAKYRSATERQTAYLVRQIRAFKTAPRP